VIAALGAWAGALRGELQRRLGAAGPAAKPAATTSAPSPVDAPDHHRLWSALGHDPSTMDQLVERTGLTAAALSSILLGMELQGRVSVEHGRYCRRSASFLSSAPTGASQGT
jgi:DNA processing protein